MAKEGKKLELYEILAAKRAKGKLSIPVDKTGPMYEEERQFPDGARADGERLVIIDGALDGGDGTEPHFRRQTAQSESAHSHPAATAFDTAEYAESPVEPRRHSLRDIHFGLDTVFVLFVIVLALIGSTYFLGYKRGQEERPAGLVGLSDIENANPNMYGLRNLDPPARTTIHPPDQDYTLVLRTEPAENDLPERVERELAEAMVRGSREAGVEVQGFLFRNSRGNDVRYILAVGIAKTPDDQELNRLLQIYNTMEGITLSREPRPYIGCQIAQVRDLGMLVE